MTKRLGRTNRVEFRLPPDLDAQIRAECARRGWNITEWGERACRCLLSELAAVPSEARGVREGEQSGPAPVPSSESDGVRPAAPLQGPPRQSRAQANASRKVGGLGNIGPKPLSATKPRPKATKKGKA